MIPITLSMVSRRQCLNVKTMSCKQKGISIVSNEEIDTISEMLYEQLEKALLAVTRTDREFTMIAYRFGIFDKKWRTLQETGDIFNLSRE